MRRSALALSDLCPVKDCDFCIRDRQHADAVRRAAATQELREFVVADASFGSRWTPVVGMGFAARSPQSAVAIPQPRLR